MTELGTKFVGAARLLRNHMAYVIGTYCGLRKREEVYYKASSTMQREIFNSNLFKNIESTSEETLQLLISKTAELTAIPIAKPNMEYINLIPGGVVGDCHFSGVETVNNLYYKRRINEVNLFTSEELCRLNKLFGTTIEPGIVGENILTTGIDIDNLPIGTLLKIGTATLRIAGRRSLCIKFVNVFIKKNFLSRSEFFHFDRTKVGMATQVVEAGTVTNNDQIEVLKLGKGMVYNPNLKTNTGSPVRFELFKIDEPNLPPIPFVDD